MKFIKTKSIEILTNGSINLTEILTFPKQISVFKKDYKNLNFSKKTRTILNNKKYSSLYKNYYKF